MKFNNINRSLTAELIELDPDLPVHRYILMNPVQLITVGP